MSMSKCIYIDRRYFVLHCDVGVCCENSAAASPQSDSGSTWHRKDRDLCHDRLPPGSTGQRVRRTDACILFLISTEFYILIVFDNSHFLYG